MRIVYVALPDETVEKLRELARREYRDPRSQAAVLIVDGLRRAGLEVVDRNEQPKVAAGR